MSAETRAPTERFSDRVDDYRRHRPGYPDAALDEILAGLPQPHTLIAADVGAGTGISSRLLADRGARVLAIEPNAPMRAGATEHPRVTWIDGTAEATTLGAASVHLVLCAQSFHWFRPEEALTEFARILTRRPPGRVALMWNVRDENDPFTSAYGHAVIKASGAHPAASRFEGASQLTADARFSGYRSARFANAQTHDRAGLIGRALSASYVPTSGPALDALRAELHDLHARYCDAQGLVRLQYVCEVHTATLA